MSKRIDNLRDDAARAIATFAFNVIATKRYRDRLTDAINLGLKAAQDKERAKAPTVSLEWLDRMTGRGSS